MKSSMKNLTMLLNPLRLENVPLARSVHSQLALLALFTVFTGALAGTLTGSSSLLSLLSSDEESDEPPACLRWCFRGPRLLFRGFRFEAVAAGAGGAVPRGVASVMAG